MSFCQRWVQYKHISAGYIEPIKEDHTFRHRRIQKYNLKGKDARNDLEIYHLLIYLGIRVRMSIY